MSAGTICPHCEFESHDDEICNSCGKMLHDDVQQISYPFRQAVQDIRDGLKSMGFCEMNKTILSRDEDFGMLPGEIGYNLYNDEMF